MCCQSSTKTVTNFPSCASTTICLLKKLTIKSVGPRHEIAASEFLGELLEHCRMIDISRHDLFFIGSGRMASRHTNRSKEPEEALRPKNTRLYALCFPTLVVEVGRSESLGQLRNDAHFWLTHTDQQVRVVILIHIQADKKKVHLEHWELLQRDLSRAPQHAKPTKLQRRKTFQSLTSQWSSSRCVLVPITKIKASVTEMVEMRVTKRARRKPPET